MGNLKRKLKREVRKAFCVLLAAAMLSSGMELPTNAAEQTEEVLVEETQTETESVLEEEETQTETETAFKETQTEEQTEAEIVSETFQEQTETETEEILFMEETDYIEMEETDCVEEQEYAASYTYSSKPLKPWLMECLLPGGEGVWSFDSETGTLTVKGKGEFNSRYGPVPWAEYRDQIKTAVISLTGTKDFSNCLYNCKNLTSVDLSKTDTSSAVNMNGMFMNCYSLEKIDISGFDTSNVTDMGDMFRECRSLKQLTFGTKFKTDKVTDMEMMFHGIGVESLDLSGFDMSKVTYGTYMIYSYNILEIKAPRNLNMSVPFRAGTWVDSNGVVITELPKNQSTSVLVKQRPTLKARRK
ncbi:MAG: DUF285 domain-containing protein [Lachnospiraceae bacterium]